MQESVIPDRHQRLEYNYSIDVLDIFKVSNTITLKDYSSMPSSLLHVAKGLIYDQLLSSTEREREVGKPMAGGDTMMHVFVFFEKYASISRKRKE